MLTRLAISGYRSIRELALDLGPMTIVTGANGSGKSSLYRALRLLSDVAQGRLINALAKEGGLYSTLWAGPEKISAAMRRGEHPVQGTVRAKPVSLKLGFSSEDFGYAVDLGLPAPGAPFGLDPEIKVEAAWVGEKLRPSALIAERHNGVVRLRKNGTGDWRSSMTTLSAFDSMMTHCADPDDGIELLLLRERMRGWRFYDALRTDPDAPARRPQVMTFTPVLASDGADVAAAIATIMAIGDAAGLDAAIDDAFPGSEIVGSDDGRVAMQQKGLLRPLSATELSDGTLRYMLLVAALLSPRPPELMVLNEPESSLHPSLLAPLARLLARAAERCQIILVTHNQALVDTVCSVRDVTSHLLAKDFGETRLTDDLGAAWVWPTR